MKPNTFQTRGVYFAYLTHPSRVLRREEAARIHGVLCERLRYDDLSFRYSTTDALAKPDSKPFSVTFDRREGRGIFKVVIDCPGVGQPTRLLMAYDFPPTPQHVNELFDPTAESVFEQMGGDRAFLSAEARVRAQCGTRGDDALGFIKRDLLRLPDQWVEGLGKPLTMASIRFEIDAGPPMDDPLSNPRRELQIEVLKEDPRCLYLELVSQWPIVSLSAGGAGVTASARQLNAPPSEFVDEAQAFLEGRVDGLEGREQR